MNNWDKIDTEDIRRVIINNTIELRWYEKQVRKYKEGIAQMESVIRQREISKQLDLYR